MKVRNLIRISLDCFIYKTLFVFILISPPASLLPTLNSTSITKITPIVTSFRSIMDHLNSLKFPEVSSDSKSISRSTYPAYPTYQPHKLTYPYNHHIIKKNILPTQGLEIGNQNLSDSTGKYYTFPEPFSSPVYADLAYRQTAHEIVPDYNAAATTNGLSYNPLPQYSSTIPMTNPLGQQNYQLMYRPNTLYGYSGNEFGYGGLNHESGHSSGHYQHHHPQVQHGGSNHHTIQYIPIPVAVGHDKSGNNHHKHDLTTLLAAIALAAGLPLLLGALLLPLGVLFLLNLATLIAVLATGLGAGAGNGTRIENPISNRGRRSLTNYYTVDHDNQFISIFQEIILNLILEIIQKAT